MISVPQLLGVLFGTGVALGAAVTVALYSAVPPKKRVRAIKCKEVRPGSNHYTAVAGTLQATAAAAVLRWYGPEFSPKAVPRFYDVSGLTEDPAVFRQVVDVFVSRFKLLKPPVTHIAGYDARGFLLAAPIALDMGVPCVLLRKDAKSPGVLAESAGYTKEYAEAKADQMSLRVGSISPGDNVVLIDDLIATGGTALAGFELVKGLGANVAEFAAVICLPGLDGKRRYAAAPLVFVIRLVCQTIAMPCSLRQAFPGVAKIRAAQDGAFKTVSVFTLLDDDAVGDDMGRDPARWREKSRSVPCLVFAGHR